MSTPTAPAPADAAPVTVETQPDTASTSPDTETLDLDALTREVLAETGMAGDSTTTADDGVDIEKHLDEAGLPARDENGRFTAKAEGEPEEAPVAEAEPTTTEPAEAKPERGWKAYNADGTEAEPPALEIEFKADGRTLKKPLADVVRLAQRGQFNERLHEEVEGARTLREQEVPRLQAETARAQNEAAQLAEAVRALLADPEEYDRAREEYAGMLTPEAEVGRLRAQLQQQEQQTAHQQAAHSTREMLSTRAVPALEQMAAKYTTIPVDDLLARYAALARPYMVNGVVPPSRFPDVARALDETAQWAESLHESRSETARLKAEADDARQQMAAEKARTEQAQREAREARRGVARAVAPAGRAAPDVPRQAPPRNADEAISQVLDRAMANIG